MVHVTSAIPVDLVLLDEMVMVDGAGGDGVWYGTGLVAVWRRRDRPMPPCRHGRRQVLHQVHDFLLLFFPLFSSSSSSSYWPGLNMIMCLLVS
jgi:hypothetical protein